jgi:PAS domain-containing protein
MRDQHRQKQDLIGEVVALRKQISDLQDAMAARRRVEDALRHSEEQLRALLDCSPLGLGLFQSDGTPVAVNRPLTRMLGYDSAAELVRVGGVVGVFAGQEEVGRLLADADRGGEWRDVLFRSKDARLQPFRVMAAASHEPAAIALVVLEALRLAGRGDTRSG